MNKNININYVEFNDSVDNGIEEHNNDLFLSFDNPDNLNNNIETISNRDSDSDTIEESDDNLGYIEYKQNQQHPRTQNIKYYSQPKNDIYHSDSNINPYLDHLFENKNKTMNQINRDIDETKTHLRNNIDSLLERDVKISDIEDKSELLLGQSENFKKRSKQLKLTICHQYFLHIISIIGIIIIIITLILILVKS